MKSLLLTLTLVLLPLAYAENSILKTVSRAPNPAFAREATILLDGEWKLGTGDTAENLDYIVPVPFVPQSKQSGLKLDSETFFYEREFELPADWGGGILHFEGVDYESASAKPWMGAV